MMLISRFSFLPALFFGLDEAEIYRNRKWPCGIEGCVKERSMRYNESGGLGIPYSSKNIMSKIFWPLGFLMVIDMVMAAIMTAWRPA